MNKYQFKDISRVFVTGDIHGEFKTLFNGIKNNLEIKAEDVEKTHPMEIERLARKKAKEAAIRNEGLRRYRMPRYEMPYDMPAPDAYAVEPASLKSSLESTLAKMKGYSLDSMFRDSIVFVAGDCGFGFNKEKYYLDILERYNKILGYNNAVVIFVRGNHDDPSYFDGERINFSNIKAVPDYSIIEIKDKTILCVGGAISTDRTWRSEQEKRINRFSSSKVKRLYWDGEAPVFDGDKLNEVVNNTEKIDYIISHTAPSFASPVEHSGIQEWSEKDPNLKKDVSNERLVMDKIFEFLRDNNRKPSYWAYGHFDIGLIEKRSETIFRALPDGFNPMSVEQDIMFSTMSADETRKKKKKNSKAKKISANPFGNNGIGRIEMDPRPIDIGRPEHDWIEEAFEMPVDNNANADFAYGDLADGEAHLDGEAQEEAMPEVDNHAEAEMPQDEPVNALGEAVDTVQITTNDANNIVYTVNNNGRVYNAEIEERLRQYQEMNNRIFAYNNNGDGGIVGELRHGNG